MKFIFFTLVLLIILIYIIKKKHYLKARDKSIQNYLECVLKSIKNNKIEIFKEYEFKRYIKYENDFISLGKIIFDSKNSKVLIYETFVYEASKLICIPDIRIFDYNSIVKCNIYNGNNLVKNVFNISRSNYNNWYIKIDLRNNYDDVIIIRFSSINDSDLFVKVYKEFNEIISYNKKIV